MNKFDDQQKEAVMRAAREAGIYHKEFMAEQVGEIRTFLTTEGQGGMKTSELDKTDFIAAAQRVQDRYAAEKGEDFTALVKSIRDAAN